MKYLKIGNNSQAIRHADKIKFWKKGPARQKEGFENTNRQL
jgi:hypothetical protein